MFVSYPWQAWHTTFDWSFRVQALISLHMAWGSTFVRLQSKCTVLSRQFLLPVVFADGSPWRQSISGCSESVKLHLTDTAAQPHRSIYATCAALIALPLTRQFLLPQNVSGSNASLYCEGNGCRTGSSKLPTGHAQRPSIMFNHGGAFPCKCNWFANCVTKGWQL